MPILNFENDISFPCIFSFFDQILNSTGNVIYVYSWFLLLLQQFILKMWIALSSVSQHFLYWIYLFYIVTWRLFLQHYDVLLWRSIWLRPSLRVVRCEPKEWSRCITMHFTLQRLVAQKYMNEKTRPGAKLSCETF